MKSEDENEVSHLRSGDMQSYAEVADQDGISEDHIIKIYVSGILFETLRTTLDRYPSTLLGDQVARQNYFIESRNALFFDKNIQAFESILSYYQNGGTLVRPVDLPMALFADEVRFFRLGQDALHELQAKEGYIRDVIPQVPQAKWQRQIWQLFECPESSYSSKAMAIWSVAVIVLSIVKLCLETLPANTSDRKEKYDDPWLAVEMACMCWFTIEFAMRFLSSPVKLTFLKSIINIIDLCAILPYFVTVALNLHGAPLSVLRAVRLVRVFRIFKLSRHSLALRVLGHTLKASVSELGMLMFFLALGVIIFSSAIYYCESEENDMFRSIPDAFWYCVVTMTTVGYGDKYPITAPGKLVGALCAVVGVLTIALPVPVIVSNFEHFYKSDTMNCILERERERLRASSKSCSLIQTSLTPPSPLRPASPKRILLRTEIPSGTPESIKRQLILSTPKIHRERIVS